MPTLVASRGKLAGNDVHFENMNWRQTPCARNHAALIGVLSDLRWAFEHISFSFNRPRESVQPINFVRLASGEPGAALQDAQLFHCELFSSLKNGRCHDRPAVFSIQRKFFLFRGMVAVLIFALGDITHGALKVRFSGVADTRRGANEPKRRVVSKKLTPNYCALREVKSWAIQIDMPLMSTTQAYESG